MFVRTSAFLVALALAISGLAGAQETTGTVAGRVVDAQGLAVPGATVTLTGPQGPRSFVTDADGRFSSPFLTPGTYTVRAELQGFKAAEAKNIVISLDTTTTVNLKMEVGGLTETVEVIGAAAAIDTNTTTIGGVLDSEMLSMVPIGRRMTDTLYLAPGVSSGGAVGRANPSMSGASGLDNLYIVDGVNVTNTGYGAIGSYSIIFGSLGRPPRSTSSRKCRSRAAVTKRSSARRWAAWSTSSPRAGPTSCAGRSSATHVRARSKPHGGRCRPPTARSTPSASRRATSARKPVDRSSRIGSSSSARSTRRGRRARSSHRTASRCRASAKSIASAALWSYSAKATWQAASAHRVDASFFGDPSNGDMGPQRTSSLLVHRHLVVQRARLRRPQPDGPLRRRRSARTGWSRLVRPRVRTRSTRLPRWTMARHRHDRRRRSSSPAASAAMSRATTARTTSTRPRPRTCSGDHQLKYGVLYRGRRVLAGQAAHRSDVHGADGRQTATGATVSDSAGRRTSARSTVSRAPISTIERDDAPGLLQLLRPGPLEGRRSPDDQRRPAVRRAGAGRHDPAADDARRRAARRLPAEEQLGAAPRLRLRRLGGGRSKLYAN